MLLHSTLHCIWEHVHRPCKYPWNFILYKDLSIHRKGSGIDLLWIPRSQAFFLFSCFEVIFFLQCIIFLVDVWNARKREFSADHARYQWNRKHLHLLSIPGVTPYIHRAFLSHLFSLVPPPPEDIRQQLPSWDPGGSLGGSALRQRNLLKAGWMFSREARFVTPPRVTLVASLSVPRGECPLALPLLKMTSQTCRV